MSDQDFDFHRPTERREAKRFEPPPWEREAFEELQRKRTTEEPGPEQAEPVEREEPAEAAPVVGESAGASTAPSETPVERGAVSAGADGRPAVEERVVLELLAGLRAEEPSIQPTVQRVSLVSALIVSAIGTVMILWGMAALVGSRASGPIGVFGGAVLLFFGAVAIAGAVWLTVRTLRQRGVL